MPSLSTEIRNKKLPSPALRDFHKLNIKARTEEVLNTIPQLIDYMHFIDPGKTIKCVQATEAAKKERRILSEKINRKELFPNLHGVVIVPIDHEAHIFKMPMMNMKGGQNMRLVLLGLFVLVVGIVSAGNQHGADIDDNEFAEFEELDEDEVMFEDTKQDEVKEQRVERKVDETVAEEDEDDDATVETEDDEFEHFNDEEEFVGFDKDRESTKPKEKIPELKINQVPQHLPNKLG
ncbi:unnamed protein product [Mytilus edulis]|uniref:Uncharacterized protein n=1 Tax=Mytilus edulis TaxID=6550 RepID=A0A8S3R154_MYTED|nr:unnamed protein product [Mytilus edulis]